MEVKRNPKDSLKSTWQSKAFGKRNWGLAHWVLSDIAYNNYNEKEAPPIHQKSDKVPNVSHWRAHCWILSHALIPMILHQAFCTYTGRNMKPIVAFIYYSIALKIIAIRELKSLTYLSTIVGFFDGDKHKRDGVPDHAVSKVFYALISTSTFRPVLITMLAYRSSEMPNSINWLMLPLEIGVYQIVLDFWFYWYHRIMHASESLWKHHRTHHLTKHPNPLLTLYADHEQESFDIIGIPLLTWCTMKLMGFPMGFYEFWICSQYVIHTELMGHSGLRMHYSPPSTLNWFLKLFDGELRLEDHDLHHRTGWKKSHNYGKQTRLWDVVFGTTTARVEGHKDNIDFDNPVPFPIF